MTLSLFRKQPTYIAKSLSAANESMVKAVYRAILTGTAGHFELIPITVNDVPTMAIVSVHNWPGHQDLVPRFIAVTDRMVIRKLPEMEVVQ